MSQLFFNNARGVLAESVSTGSTLLKIKDHANIPTSLAIGDYFLLTLFRDTTRYGENIEVVKVTAITAGTNGQLNLTVEREYEFPAQIHTAGARLEARLTAQSLRDLLSEAKSFTQAEVAALLDAAPGALDTLNELAAALGDDPNFAATMTTELGKKLDKTSYTAADVLAKLLTVDGNGSGLDADTLDGKELQTIEQEYTAADQAHVDTLNPHPQYTLVEDDSATIDWNFATGKYARDNGERVETTNLGELATVTRPDAKQVVGPNGELREVPAGTLARAWDAESGEALGLVLDADDSVVATLGTEYRKYQGTWIIDAEHNDVAPLAGIGLDGAYTSGKGKLVYSYDESGGECFVAGAKAFDTPPVQNAQNYSLGHQTTSRVQYFPKKLPVAQAIARATGSVVVDYPFADGRSMSFDFVNQDYGTRSLTNALDVKRSSNLVDLFPEYSRLSPATYWDANGVLRTAGVNEPRINHDPVTGEVCGVLLEGIAENNAVWSEDMTQWNLEGGSRSLNVHTAPDGEATADLFVENAVLAPHGISVAYTPSAGVQRTISVFAREYEQGNKRYVAIITPKTWFSDNGYRYASFDLSGDGMVTEVSTTSAGAGIERYADGYYRCWLTFKPEVASAGLYRVRCVDLPNNGPRTYTGDGVSGLYFWGLQNEKGSRPSSYIKTEDAPVTRAADDLGRALGEEYNQYTGTMILEATANGPNEFWTGYASLSADGDNYIGLLAPAQTITARGQIFVDRSAGTSVSSPTMVNGQVFKAALSYSSDGGAVSYDGSTASFVSGPNNTLPNASHLTLGSYDPSGVSLGATHIRSLTYYPEAKSDSFLQEITA